MSAATQEIDRPVANELRLPEKRVPLNFKVPEHVRERVEELVELYGLMHEARGKDKKDVDITHVCNDLIEWGIDVAWATIGKKAGIEGMPQNADEWDRLKKALVRATREDAKTRR